MSLSLPIINLFLILKPFYSDEMDLSCWTESAHIYDHLQASSGPFPFGGIVHRRKVRRLLLYLWVKSQSILSVRLKSMLERVLKF